MPSLLQMEETETTPLKPTEGEGLNGPCSLGGSRVRPGSYAGSRSGTGAARVFLIDTAVHHYQHANLFRPPGCLLMAHIFL